MIQGLENSLKENVPDYSGIRNDCDDRREAQDYPFDRIDIPNDGNCSMTVGLYPHETPLKPTDFDVS